MANPANITVHALTGGASIAYPAADVIDTTGVVPILAADTGGITERLLFDVESTSGPQSFTILHGDNPPAAREALGNLTFNVDATAATLTTALAGADNDLTFTAVNGGTAGNAITVAYTDAGAGQALAVGVVGNAIDVTLETDGAGAIQSTAADIAAEIAATPAAAALVTAANAAGNDGTGVVIAMVATNLAGGAAVRRVIGPFESARYMQNDGTVQLSFVVVAGQTLSVRCYQMPKVV